MKTTQTAPPVTVETTISSIEESGGVTLDPAQRQLAATVTSFLNQAAVTGSTTALDHTGFYIYGPPGRGKTWLMSELFAAAPFPEESKKHVHFHDFFRSLQQQFGAKTSTRDAIDATLVELLTGTELFFFDELHVHDPGSAALLNRLLAEIAHRGIPTLMTSNYEPGRLLPDLRFHHVIEPGIKVIQENFSVITLNGGTDYRSLNVACDVGFASGQWLSTEPGQQPNDALIAAGLTPPSAVESTTVLEGHRMLRATAVRDSEIWFDFSELLSAPSVTSDYLELTEQFTSWVLINVPRLSRADPASRQRLVTLIDVLVDRDLPLTVCSEVSREGLVDIDDPPVDLFRAQSRLGLLK